MFDVYRSFCVASLGSFLVLLCCRNLLAQSSQEPPDQPPPNFVIIMADDLGYGDIGCYDGWIDTPAIDELANRGVRMTDFHSSGNVCSPTRAGLLTGRYQQRAGIPGVVFADPNRREHQHGIQDVEVTFAESLKEAGYATAIMGKWHLGYRREYNPIRHGFDRFHGYVSGNIDFFSHIDQAGNYDWWMQDSLIRERGYSTHLITDHAVRFILDNADRPFCLYVAHEAPHYPYQGPNDSAERTVGGEFKNQGSAENIREKYNEMVVEMDKGVAEIVETLDRMRLRENTIILFFSDNGANRHGSNSPFRGNKGSNWEGGHRVPCVISWPSVIAEGETCDQLSISLDVMPTLLAAAGVEPDASRPLDGMDLLPVILGEEPNVDRKLFWNGRAMRDGPWKLIAPNRPDQFELYNLAEDPAESNDLAAEFPERVADMTRDLEAWRADVRHGATEQPDRDPDEAFLELDEAVEAFRRIIDADAASVAVSFRGDLIYAKGFGSPRPSGRIDSSPENMFRIASLSKPITAALVREAVNEGLFDLDDHVLDLISIRPRRGDVEDPRIHEITVGHLLDHQGGWNIAIDEDPIFQYERISREMRLRGRIGIRNILEYVLEFPLQFDPGTETAYSNIGYLLLGRVLEEAHGQPLANILQEKICDMHDIDGISIARTNRRERPDEEVAYPRLGDNLAIELMDAPCGMAATPSAYCQFMHEFWLDGSRRDRSRTGEFEYFGSLPGTTTMALQKQDGLDVVVFYNNRREQSYLEDNQVLKQSVEAALQPIRQSDFVRRRQPFVR